VLRGKMRGFEEKNPLIYISLGKTMNEDIIDIDFQPINEIINKVITTLENKLEREVFFEEKFLQTSFRLLFKMAIINFEGILYLCESSEKNKNLLYLNSPPLNRSLFDNLFQTILIFEDITRFQEFFLKTRLREAMEINAFRKKEYGKDEEADKHIEDLIMIIEEDFPLTKEQKKDFKKLPKHTSTNQIVNEFSNKKKPISKLLTYLRDLYYLNLSQFSHSQPTAYVSYYHQIIETDEGKLEEFVNNERFTAVNFILCIFSEIEINLNLNLKEDLSILWSYIKEGSPFTNKIYDLRYKDYFPALLLVGNNKVAPNQKMSEVLKRIKARQKDMRFTDGSKTQEILREGRDGGMFGE
jgi:hypothetical protein